MRLIKLLKHLINFQLQNFKRERKIGKIFAGCLVQKKASEQVTNKDIKNTFKNNLTYSKLSCADSIFNTFKISLITL